MKSTITEIGLSILVLVFATTLGDYLSVADILPNLPLLWIVALAIRHGQIAGTLAGFVIGLMLDFLSGGDGMLGLSALASTLGGFIAGYFYNENKVWVTLGGGQFIVIVIISSLVHNLIYFLIFLQGTDIRWWAMVFRYAVPTTAYTAAVAVLPMFWVGRRHASQT